MGRHTCNAELQEAEDEQHTRNSNACTLESEETFMASVLGQEFDKTLQDHLCGLGKVSLPELYGANVSQVVRLKYGWKTFIL